MSHGASSVRIKICGITRAEDAQEAARLGADALGFNFWSDSTRYIRPAAAREIIRTLPPLLSVVGVFVNATRDEILRVAERCRLHVVQLHGDESPSFCAKLGFPFIRAIRFEGPGSLASWDRASGTLLIDAPTRGYGGSGKTFDWRLLQGATKARRIILAGGLTAENIARAVRTVHPYGVDVATGVESSPGIKDAARMARFISVARATALESNEETE
jgi:phosphoribosylanthranilate isomerase